MTEQVRAALAGIVDQLIAQHPEASGRFRAAFGQHTESAGQWIGHALASAPSAPSATAAAAGDPRALAWLTPGHIGALGALSAVRGDWHAWLPAQLSEWWPEWEQSDPATLATWLDGWLPTLTAEPPAVAAAEAPRRALGWVPPALAAALDELTDIRGDWRGWLPGELDARVPEWEEMPLEDLVARMDALVGLLVLPADAVEEFADQVLLPALDDIPEAAELTEEELMEILDALVEEVAAAADAAS